MSVTFTDSRGVHWVVREGEDEPSLAFRPEGAGRMPGEYLRFESDREVRRLWNYPADWERLPATTLEHLCSRAHVVAVRFRPPRGASASPRADEPTPPIDRAANE